MANIVKNNRDSLTQKIVHAQLALASAEKQMLDPATQIKLLDSAEEFISQAISLMEDIYPWDPDQPELSVADVHLILNDPVGP